jgi:hypothetical protein
VTLGGFWFLDCLAFWESTSSSSLLGGELFALFGYTIVHARGCFGFVLGFCFGISGNEYLKMRNAHDFNQINETGRDT